MCDCFCFPDRRSASLPRSYNPDSGVQFILAAASSFFAEMTKQSDEGFPGPPLLRRSVGEPTWFSEMLCPVTLYILFFFLAQYFQVVKVSLSETQQGKQLLYMLEKIKLGVTDIVDLKSTFSEGGFWNTG